MSTTANTAFAVTYARGFWKVAFTGTVGTFYFNVLGKAIAINPTNVNYVDIADDWDTAKTITVDWRLCSSPVAGNRVAWIDAFNALYY